MIEITCDTAGLTAKMTAASAEVGKRLLARMKPIGTHLHTIVQRDEIRKGGLLQPHTGNLQRSIRSAANDPSATTASGDAVSTKVWFDPSIAKYGAIQEYGGTIIPKRTKFLAIPLAAMKKASGAPIAAARDVFANPGEFGYKKVFVAKNVIFGMRGTVTGATAFSGGRRMVECIPLFALKRSVVIPARAPLRTALRTSEGYIGEQVSGATGEVVTFLEGSA